VKLTIDNLDGLGAVDYSAGILADRALAIERALNAPSRCTGALNAGAVADPGSGTALIVPVRRGRVTVSANSGVLLFTGYLATEPVPIYAGVGIAGPLYGYSFTAISDEWLLDKQSLTLAGAGFNTAGATLLDTFATRVDPGLLTTSGLVVDRSVGVFVPEPAKSWSANAGGIADSSYAAYRALGGALILQTVGSVVHELDFDSGEGDGSLQVATLETSMVKELANDVTLTGQMEPTAYVTEVFAGDGTTTLFTLSEEPFRVTPSSLLSDSFNQAAINVQTWNVTDPGTHLSLADAGLVLGGGTGFDGQTTLSMIDQVEMGGTLVIEAGDVQLTSPSDGVLCGLYYGTIQRANCFAGYNVRQSGGSTVVNPFVNGAEIGADYTLLAGHTYTLRMRLHSVEMQRVLQTYYARIDGTITSFGGGLATSPMSIVFDLQDLGDGSNTPATVLYDGAVPASPAVCTFAAVDSVQLTGSIGFCRLTQAGSAWVVSTLPGGAKQTRLIGIAGEGVDCQIAATGKVTFFAGRIPVAGELISILYRIRDRSVTRLQDAASVAAEAAGGMPGTARWLGKVLKPPARCGADCESAAQAVLAFASSRAAAIAGSYAAINPATDMWPGDVLSMIANGRTINAVVRKVDIQDGNALPELLSYRVEFANDWADSVGIGLSESVALDALLPETALPAPGEVLANLQQLTIASVTGTTLQLDAGVVPPTGGGFEVRLRDWGFGPNVDQDLVLRSPVESFSIPRSAQVERYYVRMYDVSVPPLYSRLSSAVFTNLPVG